MFRIATAILLGAILTCGAASAQVTPPPAVDVAGVRYETSAQVGGSRLLLNGAGIRHKFVVKVYTAGLYLTSKAATTEAVLAAPGPKRIHIVALRDIDGNDLAKLFARGMQDNAPREEFSKSVPGTLRFADLFSIQKKLKEGESFSLDYVPGVGTSFLLNGKPQGEPIREPEFFSALLRIWLGTSPADAQLKDLLLGKAPADNFRNR